jgi:rod shape-determining protein MreD
MIARLLFVAGFFVAMLVQLYLPSWAIFGNIKPPVLLSLVLYHALNGSVRTTFWAVGLAVLFQDSLDLGGFGPALLGFPLVAVLAHRVQEQIFLDHLLTQMIFGALAALVAMAVSILVYTLTGQRAFSFSQTLLRLVGSFFLGLGTFPILMWCTHLLTNTQRYRRSRRWL